jgi:hypothetical protein
LTFICRRKTPDSMVWNPGFEGRGNPPEAG